jgi:TonB family protein
MDDMLKMIFPGLSNYGAVELKRYSRTFFVRGLFFAVLIHFFLLGIYWIDVSLTKNEKPKIRLVRIMKYEELGPPPSVAENTYGEDLYSDRGTIPANRGRSGSGSSSSVSRRQFRTALSRAVSRKGILGMMTGVDVSMVKDGAGVLAGNGDGEGEDLGKNLDELLSSVGNGNSQETLDSGGGGGEGSGSSSGTGTGTGVGGVRGSRSGRLANLDDVVARLGDSRVGSISRKGELKIEKTSEMAGQAKKSVYRSPDVIREVLLRHVNVVKYCYERALRQNPELKGKVAVRITVVPDGSVSDADIVSSTLNNADVEQCILSRIRMWKDFEPIDPIEGSVTFKQTYTFGT